MVVQTDVFRMWAPKLSPPYMHYVINDYHWLLPREVKKENYRFV